MFKKRRAVTVNKIDEMFNGFNSQPVNNESKKISFYLGRISALILASATAGLILASPAVYVLSAGTEIAKPFVEVWKKAPDKLPDVAIAEKNVFLDINGTPFAEIYVQDRTPLSNIDEVSPFVVQALIATEDKRFYEHKGFDVNGTFRAFLKGGGGSGITQQLVKNLQYYDINSDLKNSATEATLERKIRELKMALEYDENHSKDEILLKYLNTVAFGGPNIYSIESASKYFFSKPAKDLNLAEASLLVGTVQNPALYNLDDDKLLPQARERQNHVLNRMVSEGVIKDEDRIAIMNSPVSFKKGAGLSGNCYSSSNPFYCDYTLRELRKDARLGETQEERDARIARGGIVVRTFLDPEITSIIQAQVDADYGRNNRVVMPVVVAENNTGGIRAIAFNRGYGENAGETTINIPLHKSSTGSVFKLFTLASALRNGFEEKDLVFGSRCPLKDSRIDTPPGGFTNSSGCGYQNAPNMDYKRATAISSNTWFVELLLKVGIEKIKNFNNEIGLTAPESIGERSASYTLGVTEHAPVDVASATAMFHNGVYCPATPIRSLASTDGSEIAPVETWDPNEKACRRVLSEKDASTVRKAMVANMSPGGYGYEKRIPGAVVGGKSGTNEKYSQAFDMIFVTGKGEKLAIYGNTYDMTNTTTGEGVGSVVYRGYNTSWIYNPPGTSLSDIVKKIMDSHGKGSVELSATDDTLKAGVLSKRAVAQMPSLIGMTPEEAVSTLNAFGIFDVKVSKHRVAGKDFMLSGTVAEQSIPPGEEILYKAYSESKRKSVVLKLKE